MMENKLNHKQEGNILQIFQEEFWSIFHSKMTPLAVINPDIKIAEANNAFCRFSGYTHEEVIGMNWTQLIADDKIDCEKKNNKQWLSFFRDVPIGYEICIYNKQGKKKYAYMTVSPMPENNIKIISFVDITEHKHTELVLAKQSNELKNLVASMNKEITFNLLQLTQNNKFNQQLSLKLIKLREQIKSENRSFLSDIDKLIDETASNHQSNNWEMLKKHFMQTRPTFLIALLDKHPNLTDAEQKLAALVSLQITTKEIALITSQVYDSVRVSRTRLKKKLGLSKENSLVAYLRSF